MTPTKSGKVESNGRRGLEAENTVVDVGWYLIRAKHLQIVYLDENVEETSWQRFMDLNRQDLKAMIRDRSSIIYDIPRPGAINAVRRGELGDMMSRPHRRIESSTNCFALVTSSAEVKGSTRAIFWIAPPPFPHRTFSRFEDAFEFVQQSDARLDGARITAEYLQMRRALILESRQQHRLVA